MPPLVDLKLVAQSEGGVALLALVGAHGVVSLHVLPEAVGPLHHGWAEAADPQRLLPGRRPAPALQRHARVLADVDPEPVLRGVLQRALRALEILRGGDLVQAVLQDVRAVRAGVEESDGAGGALVRWGVLVLDGAVSRQRRAQGKRLSALPTLVWLGPNFTPLHFWTRVTFAVGVFGVGGLSELVLPALVMRILLQSIFTARVAGNGTLHCQCQSWFQSCNILTITCKNECKG